MRWHARVMCSASNLTSIAGSDRNRRSSNSYTRAAVGGNCKMLAENDLVLDTRVCLWFFVVPTHARCSPTLCPAAHGTHQGSHGLLVGLQLLLLCRLRTHRRAHLCLDTAELVLHPLPARHFLAQRLRQLGAVALHGCQHGLQPRKSCRGVASRSAGAATATAAHTGGCRDLRQAPAVRVAVVVGDDVAVVALGACVSGAVRGACSGHGTGSSHGARGSPRSPCAWTVVHGCHALRHLLMGCKSFSLPLNAATGESHPRCRLSYLWCRSVVRPV